MNRITSADIINTGDYIIGEKYKVVNYLLNGIYQQISDYNNENFKEVSESTFENLIDNMKQFSELFKNENINELDDLDIIKIDYSDDYKGLVLTVYEKKNI